ncbi:Cupredoxin [Obelidium mucronatum]|nr:Cupredoxin [Obelidium mucronatum]
MLRLILQFALLQLVSARTLILPKQSSSLTQAAELLFNESTLHSSPNSKPHTTRTQFQESTTTTTTFKTLSQPTKSFTLNLSERIMNLDGISKLMMLANNQLDFPIHVNKGDFVVVTVNNNMVSNASTSIHWHGLFQKETPWMDGPGMTTQCLIQGGESLTYRFSTGSQSGTFWWHAHYASQYVDGLRGPFIIHDPGDTVKMGYDQEIIIRLGDHFHAIGLDPVPDSGIINGRGQCDCASIQTTGGAKCTTMEPTVFKVTKGTRYRLRFINMSAQAAFNVSIDGHLMTVIEQDGVPTNPTTDSVIVTANALTDNYWFRATMMDMYTPTGSKIINGLNLNVTAIWRYKGAPKSKPTSTQNTTKPLDSYSLGELNGLIESTLPVYKKFHLLHHFTCEHYKRRNEFHGVCIQGPQTDTNTENSGVWKLGCPTRHSQSNPSAERMGVSSDTEYR